MNKFSAFLASPLESQQITLVNLLAQDIENLNKSKSDVKHVQLKILVHFQFSQLSKRAGGVYS